MHDVGDAAGGDQRLEPGRILDPADLFGNAGELFRRQQQGEASGVRVGIVNHDVQPSLQEHFDYPCADTTLCSGYENTQCSSLDLNFRT